MKQLTEWLLPAPQGHDDMVFFVNMTSAKAPAEGAATCWVWLELSQGKAPAGEASALWAWASERHQSLMVLYAKTPSRVRADLLLIAEQLRAFPAMSHAQPVLKRWAAEVPAEVLHA